MGVLPEGFVRPVLDPLTEPFFTAGAIRLQRCAACGSVQHPPEDVCRRCQGAELGWRDAAGTGSVYSYTVVHHPLHPALAPCVPYAVVLVQLDDFPEVRITGNLLGLPADRVRIGLRVRATFEEIPGADGATLRIPQWEVAE